MARVLVVEDVDDVRLALCAGLVAWGHAPVPVVDGKAALEVLARDDAFDLIVLDLHMPGMGGEAFLHHRRDAAAKHIPVVVCSAWADLDRLPGAVRLVGKPVKMADLQRCIEELVPPSGRYRIERLEPTEG